MIPRRIYDQIERSLANEAAVALIGPRQVGKTTLAFQIAENRPSIYLDLESAADREKLADPSSFLKLHADKLVIIDEIHHAPELFQELRGLIDEGRRQGQGVGRFLLLGSATIELMRQSETLAGRIAYIDLGPLNVLEIEGQNDVNRLWLRGGFPRSYLADDDEISFDRRQNFIRTFLERDIPMFGPRVPAETLQRLWTMLAHNQATLLNMSQLARNLGVSTPTISSYVDLLADLLLLRRLTPYQVNVGKRLVKSPKTYIRDSGLVHTLLGIETLDELLGHPVVGNSWEGFVIENLLAVAPRRHKASFYRTARGSEIDLVLELGASNGIWAVEIKLGTAPKTTKGFTTAIEDIEPSKAFIVYGGSDRYPKTKDVEVISVRELAQELAAL